MANSNEIVDLIPDEREIAVAIIDALDDVKNAQEECLWIRVPKGQVWASGNCHDLANRMRDAFGMKTNTKGGVPLGPPPEAQRQDVADLKTEEVLCDCGATARQEALGSLPSMRMGWWCAACKKLVRWVNEKGVPLDPPDSNPKGKGMNPANPVEVAKRLRLASGNLADAAYELDSEHWERGLELWDKGCERIERLKGPMNWYMRGRLRRSKTKEVTTSAPTRPVGAAPDEAPLRLQVAAWPGRHHDEMHDEMPGLAVELLQLILKSAGYTPHRKVAIAPKQPEFRCYKCGTPAQMTVGTIDCPSHAENGRFCSFDCGHFLCEHCEGTPNCGDAEELSRRLGSISIRVDPVIGTDPERVCADAAGMSERLGVMVEFTLNGVYMVTVPGHAPGELYEEFKKRAAKK